MASKILLITEGEKTEVALLGSNTHGLLSLIGADYNVVPVGQSIYELYEHFVKDEYFDLVSYLVEKGKLKLEEDILTKSAFSAIYLVFDLDPHYQKYSDQKIKELLSFFDDETNNGKLYISYPMVEAFYDLTEGLDFEFFSRKIDLFELNGKKYKDIVYKRSHYSKRRNKLTNKELSFIITHHLLKAMLLLKENSIMIDHEKILSIQLNEKYESNHLYVLSSLALLPVDYNPYLTETIISKKIKAEISTLLSDIIDKSYH